MIENSNTEFKREYVDDIKKTIIAFGNTDGGTLFIGVDNDGNAVGIENVDDVQLRVSSAIRDSIKPDIMMFTDIKVEQIDGEDVVVVRVQAGTAKPYYIATKGIRPEGVFIRQGASTAPATEASILRMIRETAGDNFEGERSLNQCLTFDYAQGYFDKKNIAFGDEQKKTLGIILPDSTYSNLALLLSDQCVHTIKFAVFQGANKTIFKDRKEFSGSLFKQLDEVYEHIQMFNHVRADFVGLERIDKYDYPIEAIREAILNAIVHREYAFSSSTLVSIFDDRIEIVTTGGLVKGISKQDILLGISVLRNRNLAEIFYRLHLIEAYGTGMPKIRECYADHSVQPEIETSDNAFKVTLPNVNLHTAKEIHTLSNRELQVVNYIKQNGFITRTIVQEIADCSQTTAINLLKKMTTQGVIVKSGSGKSTGYLLG